MVKLVIILVLLAIGYNDIKSVLANEVEILNDELEDQLLPTKLEDYQNDGDIDPGEGSGDPFYEGNLPPRQIEETDKTPPDVAQDTDAKEQEQSVVEKSDEQAVIAKENEEEVQILQVVEEEAKENQSDNINANNEQVNSSKGEESNDTPAIEPSIESNAAVSEEQIDISKVETSNEQGAALSEEQADTSKVETSNAAVLEEQVDISKVETSNEQGNMLKAVVLEEQVDISKVETSNEQDETLNAAVSEEVEVETSNEPDDTLNAAVSEEQVETSNEQENTSNAAVSGERVDTSKVEVSNEEVGTSKLDTIDDTNPNESQNNTYDDSGSADKSDNISSDDELEPQEAVQENEMKADQDKDEHASNYMINTKFPFEKDLPAERFSNTRGLGKSMPMQEAKPNDETVVEKPVEVEQTVEETHNHKNEQEPSQLPEAVDKNRELANNLEEQKEIDDAGASSASSGSNTVTFVIILAIVGLVGIVGYFVHKRRNRLRATPVPTHEDRELKEVKTHRSNDNDGGHKQASHIPEANPLILNNSHFKPTSFAGAEAIPKNGHLPSAEQQQQLLTTLLVNNANTKDDIRMMDDDVEDEGAERRPLVLSSFKPTTKIAEVTTSGQHKDEKQQSDDDGDHVKEEIKN